MFTTAKATLAYVRAALHQQFGAELGDNLVSYVNRHCDLFDSVWDGEVSLSRHQVDDTVREILASHALPHVAAKFTK